MAKICFLIKNYTIFTV